MPLNHLLLHDVLPLITAFLEPRELQALRCANKGLKRGVTRKMMQACFYNTYAKYRRAILMPDGAVRIYTRLGRQMFDLYGVGPGNNNNSNTLDNGTPMYTLKQQGMDDQLGGIDDVRLPDRHTLIGAEFRNRVLSTGNAAVLEAAEIIITHISRACDGNKETTSLCMELYMQSDEEREQDVYHLLVLVYEFSAQVHGKAKYHTPECRPK